MSWNSLYESTKNWIEAVEEHYAGRDPNDLTQVYMRGYFAGWSEHNVYELARGLKKAMEDYPLHPDPKEK